MCVVGADLGRVDEVRASIPIRTQLRHDLYAVVDRTEATVT